MFDQFSFDNISDNIHSIRSFGEEITYNEIVQNDIDINEDEMFSLLYLKRNEPKTEYTNNNVQTIERVEENNINENDNEQPEISPDIIKVPEPIKEMDNEDKNENDNDNDNNNVKGKSVNKLENKIFNIIKVIRKNKKKGRILKKSKRKYLGVHGKFSPDNIIKKIKASFFEKSLNYINKEYGDYLSKHKIKKIKRLIQRISPRLSTKIKKEYNLNMFNLKLKDIFSEKLSSKYSLYPKDYNKTQIENLYKENKAKNVINILETSVRDMYNKYSKDIKIEGFNTLEDDLRIQREKMEENNEENIEEYLKQFKNTAQNLEQIFISKKSRNYKKNENKNISNDILDNKN